MSQPHAPAIRAAIAANPKPSEIAGYHGTSLWALIHAAQHGSLPNRSPRDQDFYYLPADYPGAFDEAKDYALNNALIHFAREFVPYESTDAVYQALDNDDLDASSLIKSEREEGVLRGIVLSLRPSITTLPDAGSAFLPPNERCVRVPRSGLPIAHIAGIQILGSADRDILSDRDLV